MFEETLTTMRQALRATVNPDGGWGYYAGTASRVEPTCWALLALQTDAVSSDSPAPPQPGFLVQRQGDDSLIIDAAEAADGQPNLAFNALAAVLLALNERTNGPAARIVTSLAQHKGIKLPASKINQQDNALQGWGWVDRTFSWVEPTSWCLIALKKLARHSQSASARIEEAERLLADRCCKSGGWNYGNANMLGQELRPYVSTTALALIALQDRRDAPCVTRSLEYLVEHRTAERSAMALALTSTALRVFGISTEDVDECLAEQWGRTGFLGNSHLTAMALYTLGAGTRAYEAFRV